MDASSAQQDEADNRRDWSEPKANGTPEGPSFQLGRARLEYLGTIGTLANHRWLPVLRWGVATCTLRAGVCRRPVAPVEPRHA